MHMYASKDLPSSSALSVVFFEIVGMKPDLVIFLLT